MGFSEAGNHGKPWFSRLPDQLLKRTAVTFGWRLFSGSSFVVEEARCRASGFECIGPLGGRDGFAFGKPLRRWNQGLPFGLWDRIHEGPTEHIVLLRYGPDAVRAGPRHVLPGLRVSYIPRGQGSGHVGPMFRPHRYEKAPGQQKAIRAHKHGIQLHTVKNPLDRDVVQNRRSTAFH